MKSAWTAHFILHDGPLNGPPACFLPPPPQVVLGTDMKQHFSTVHDFTEKLAASGLIGTTTTTTTTTGPTTSRAPPDDGVALAPGSLPSSMGQQQQPVVGAGSSRQKRPPGRTNSMLDVRAALRAAATAGPIRTVTAGK